MERRKHGRVHLQLPARIRWLSPFRLQEETQQTQDVSRGGLKISISVPAVVGTHLWVTLPYDSALPDGQPEMLVRVVRCEPRAGGGAILAGKFETLPPSEAATDERRPRLSERRASRRRLLSTPVRVRQDEVPWIDEAMSLDVSDEGLRFLSCREYEPGSSLVVSLGGVSAGPWHGKGEIRAIVARVAPGLNRSELAVSVYRLGVGAERFVRRIFADVLRVS